MEWPAGLALPPPRPMAAAKLGAADRKIAAATINISENLRIGNCLRVGLGPSPKMAEQRAAQPMVPYRYVPGVRDGPTSVAPPSTTNVWPVM